MVFSSPETSRNLISYFINLFKHLNGYKTYILIYFDCLRVRPGVLRVAAEGPESA